MAANDKYTVRLRGTWVDITKATARHHAHNLASKLGPAFMVWNKRTRRESSQTKTGVDRG